MGLLSALASCLRRLLCGAAPPPAAGAAGDTVFDDALLHVDADALRAEAHALGDAAAAASASSRAAYASGDGAGAKALSIQAGQHREAAAAKNAEAARAIFAQKNTGRGQWEIDLHQLLVAEALDRVRVRLASCTAAASVEAAGGHDLVIIYGQGHHSAGGVAKIKPAVLSFLREGGWSAREGVPNAGMRTCWSCERITNAHALTPSYVLRRVRLRARQWCNARPAVTRFKSRCCSRNMLHTFERACRLRRAALPPRALVDLNNE